MEAGFKERKTFSLILPETFTENEVPEPTSKVNGLPEIIISTQAEGKAPILVMFNNVWVNITKCEILKKKMFKSFQNFRFFFFF